MRTYLLKMNTTRYAIQLYKENQGKIIQYIKYSIVYSVTELSAPRKCLVIPMQHGIRLKWLYTFCYNVLVVSGIHLIG